MDTNLPVAPKNSNTWLIVIVVIVVLLCCCCVIGGGIYLTQYLWNNGDQIFGTGALISQLI